MRGPSRLLLFTLWLALTAGLLEGSIRLIQAGVFGQVLGLSPHVIWMAPTANIIWLGVPALLLLALSQIHWLRIAERVAVFVLVGIAIAGLVLIYPAMHKAVAALLAIGVGWRLSGWLVRSPGFERLVRRSVVPLLLVTGLSGFSIAGVRRWQEHHGLVPLTETTARRPNVLLIIWDTVRGESLSLYGYPRPTTPFLTQFAREGVRFDRAMAPAPWTLASHAAMFTGHLPVDLKSELRKPLRHTRPVIAESFTAAGFATGGFIANVAYCSREHGLNRGFLHYADFRLSVGQILNSSRLGHLLINIGLLRQILSFYGVPGHKNAAHVSREFLNWLDDLDGRPFFAFLNYIDAHQPYLPPEPFRSEFRIGQHAYRPYGVNTTIKDLTPERIAWGRGQYDGTIAYLDAELSRLVNELKRRGLLDHTLVVVTSDHGEQFGEHHLVSHGNSLYRQLLHVPLVMRLPGSIPEGAVVNHPVSLVNLARTLGDLARLDRDGGVAGTSFRQDWLGATSDTGMVRAEMYGAGRTAVSLMTQGYHYLRWFERHPELYQMETDPTEVRNLARTPSGRALVHQLALHDNQTERRTRQRK